MMKKFFYSVLAAATMLLATTSCSQEEEMLGGGTVDNGTTQKVTFKVGMPDESVASRTIADGVTVGGGNKANTLIWALYEKDKKDANNNPIKLDCGLVQGEKNEETGKHEFTAEISMVKGLTYNVLFFAYDNSNCAFQLATTPAETNLTALTLKKDDADNFNLLANQEGYDAFVKCQEHTASGSGVPTEVTLTRPFAQVNVATTKEDLDKANKLQAVVTKSDMLIKQVPTQYNVLTGAATENADLTYAASDILKHHVAAGTHPNEDITVNNESYKYLTMAYVLAGETATSDASTHDVTFKFYRGASGDECMRTINIGHLPIQRNYRTNVIGDILTEEESFKIVIDERFKNDHNVNPNGEWPIDETGLKYFLSNAEDGDVIKLAGDIALTEALNIPEGLELTLDLDGKTLSGSILAPNAELSIENGTLTNGNSSASAIEINEGELTLDNVNIESARHAIRIDGNVTATIDGGTYKVGTFGGNQTNHALNVSGGANVTINGGTFVGPKGTSLDSGAAVNVQSGSTVTIKGGSFSGGKNNTLAASGTLTVEGGTFDQDPSRFVADGYAAIENEGTYFVVSEDVDKVIVSKADLLALSAKAFTGNNGTAEEYTISILNDIDMEGAEFSAIIAQRGDKLTIKGNGHTISNVKVVSGANDNTTGQASMFYAFPNSTLTVSDLTLKDITVTADADGTGYAAAVVGYCEGSAILENVDVVNATIIGVKSSGMLAGHLSGSLEANGCELSGTVTLADYSGEANGHYAGKYIGTLAGAAEMNNCSVNVTVSGNLNAANIGEVYGRKVSGSSNVELVSDNSALSTAIQNGVTTVILEEGEYTIPSNSVTPGETLTIKGTEETIINGQSCYMDNAKLAFEGVTIKVGLGYAAPGASDYAGIYSPNATFTKCHFVGGLRVGRSGAKFEECTFTLDASDYVYTYGNSVDFSKCTFNSMGKALIVYSDGNGIGTAPVVNVKNCVFNASQKGYASAIKNQECAAVEIDNFGCGVNLTLSGNIVNENFSGEWRIKSYYTGKNNAVTVNGTAYTTLALDGKTMTIDANKNVTVQE